VNFESLAQVRFGDPDGLKEFLFENGVQHQAFAERLIDLGYSTKPLPSA